MPRKTQDQLRFEELSAKLDHITEHLAALQTELAARRHYDVKVEAHEAAMNDNGKPGLLSIRNKILGWETKINGIIALIVGDIVLRFVQSFILK